MRLTHKFSKVERSWAPESVTIEPAGYRYREGAVRADNCHCEYCVDSCGAGEREQPKQCAEESSGPDAIDRCSSSAVHTV